MSSLLTRCSHLPDLCLCLVCHISSHACSPNLSYVPPFLLIPLSPVSTGCTVTPYTHASVHLSIISLLFLLPFPPLTQLLQLPPVTHFQQLLLTTPRAHSHCHLRPGLIHSRFNPNFSSYSILPSPFPFIFTDCSAELDYSRKMEHKHGASFSL